MHSHNPLTGLLLVAEELYAYRKETHYLQGIHEHLAIIIQGEFFTWMYQADLLLR
jgi:hypothetical protein